jgi:hypothetical protein
MQRLESRELNDGITCFRRDQNPDLLSSSALHDVAISMGQKVERIDRDIDEYTAPAWKSRGTIGSQIMWGWTAATPARCKCASLRL